MARKELLGPAKNYEWGKNHFDVLETVFNRLKTDVNGRHGWNRPIEQLDGLTLSFLGPNMIKVNHAKYVVASPYVMNMKEKTEAVQFLESLMNELAKKYKEVSGTNLRLKLQDEQQDIQLYSKLSADRSWALGSFYGPAVGRYMVTTSRIYNVGSKLLPTDQ
jgi:hypothetical protein